MRHINTKLSDKKAIRETFKKMTRRAQIIRRAKNQIEIAEEARELIKQILKDVKPVATEESIDEVICQYTSMILSYSRNVRGKPQMYAINEFYYLVSAILKMEQCATYNDIRKVYDLNEKI